MKKITKAKKGFTLVELVVVIAIIGILAAILVPILLGASKDATVASMNQTASDVRKLLNSWLFQKVADKNYCSDGDPDGGVYVVIRCADGKFDDPTFVGDFWGDNVDVDEMTEDLKEYCESALGDLQKYAVAYLVNGKFSCLYYVESDEAPEGAPKPADFDRRDFWPKRMGYTTSGIAVGTSPQIQNS